MAIARHPFTFEIPSAITWRPRGRTNLYLWQKQLCSQRRRSMPDLYPSPAHLLVARARAGSLTTCCRHFLSRSGRPALAGFRLIRTVTVCRKEIIELLAWVASHRRGPQREWLVRTVVNGINSSGKTFELCAGRADLQSYRKRRYPCENI